MLVHSRYGQRIDWRTFALHGPELVRSDDYPSVQHLQCALLTSANKKGVKIKMRKVVAEGVVCVKVEQKTA